MHVSLDKGQGHERESPLFYFQIKQKSYLGGIGTHNLFAFKVISLPTEPLRQFRWLASYHTSYAGKLHVTN